MNRFFEVSLFIANMPARNRRLDSTEYKSRHTGSEAK
jgi:hypothetical protein